MDEPLKAWGVHHEDFFKGPDDLYASKALADKAKAKLEQIALDTELLKHGAPVEDEVQIPALHEDTAEPELTKVTETGAAPEAGRVGELPEPEVKAGESGHV
jgi:hypothetical protein